MTCIRTILLAFVALSLLAVAQAAQSTISHNAAVRRHASMVQDRPARRSVAIGDGKMMQKRQTAQQLADAAAQKHWNDVFQLKNSIWQQAAIAALNGGQTPPSFDQYWDGKPDPTLPGNSGSGSDSGSAETSPAPQQQDSSSGSGSSSDSSSDSSSSSGTKTDSSSDSSAATQPKSQQQTTQPSSTSSDDDCDEQSSSDSTSNTSSNDNSSTPASSAADTKNQSTQPKDNSNNNDSGSSSPSTSGSFSGQATYYAPGLGACGWTNGPSDYIVAISHSLFDSFDTGNPNNNPACGHKIAATYNGKTITVAVADRCEGCAWGDLDFTPTGFQQLASMDKGRLDGLTWSWIGAAP